MSKTTVIARPQSGRGNPKIGNFQLKSKLVLAPLSGVSDLPFRTIARANGCQFAFYEMLDAHGLTYGHKRTLKMLETNKEDSPLGVQILGCDPGRVLDAAHIIISSLRAAKQRSNLKLIDLNCACPVRKVLKKKCGSYLLKDPKKAGKVIKKLAQNTPLPITVKVRAGYTKNDGLEGLKLAKIAQENGASAVFMHGRSMAQGYSGKVNYEPILKAKKALKIPLLGSGDVLTPELAKQMLDETNCDGILVARGAMGSPWIFDETEKYLKDPTVPPPSASYEQVVKTAQTHLQLYKDWKDGDTLSSPRKRGSRHCHPERSEGSKSFKTAERYYMGHIRKIAIWYSKGLPYSKRARQAISESTSFDEVMEVLGKLESKYDLGWKKR